MKEKFIKAYLDVAKRFAELSTARRLKVGAIIVKDDKIISIGFNGTPSGWDNNCEYEEEIMMSEFGKETWFEKTGELKTHPEVLHAESNSISKLARTSGGGEGATMFITHAPCLECAKLIYQSGIKSVYFGEMYRSKDGIDFLKKCNLDIVQLKD